MNLDTVDHITISVSNLENSINWYQSSFDCEVIFQESNIAVLQFANIKLVLSLPSAERPHIGYLRPDAGSFGEVREMLGGTHGTYISDPTGNIVELVAKSHADTR